MSSYDYDSARLARMYDRISDHQFEGGKRLVERLGIDAGAHVLDLGCGTGRLARHIADRTGANGVVVGIDPLPERITLARQNVPHLRFEVGGAEDLSMLADSSFDFVCLNAVFHWIEHKPKALAEIRRVLRAGGRVGCTTLPKELRLRSTIGGTVTATATRSPYVEHLQPSGVEVMNRQPTTTEIITLLNEQDLDLIELHVVRTTRHFARGQDIVDFADASSFGNFVSIVPDGLQDSLRADLATAFELLRGANGIEMRQHGLVFIAERPADPRMPTA